MAHNDEDGKNDDPLYFNDLPKMLSHKININNLAHKKQYDNHNNK